MTDRLEILVLPSLSSAQIARALSVVEPSVPSLVALVVPVERAGASAVRLFDEDGRPADVDLSVYAAALSQGGHAVGVATVDPVGSNRAWQLFRDGALAETFGADDELYVPHDEDGFPDLEATPVRRSEGVPDGWRPLRTCLDLGMERLVSCRFTPVTYVFEQLRGNRGVQAHAYTLATGGHALRPPQETPWQDLYRRR